MVLYNYSNLGKSDPAARMAPTTTGAASRMPWAMAIPWPTWPIVFIILVVQGWLPDWIVFDVSAEPAIVLNNTGKE